MKRTKEEAERTRHDIIDAGLRVFGAKGVEAARVEDIAKEAGVTRGAFYYYFKNKMELYVELLEARAGYYKRIIDDSFSKDLLPLERIRCYMTNVLQKVGTDDKFAAFNEMVLYKSHNVNLAIESINTDESQRLIPTQIFIDSFEDAKASEEINSDMSVEYFVWSIFIFLQGAIVFRSMNRDRFTLEDKAVGLVDTFLSGLVKR